MTNGTASRRTMLACTIAFGVLTVSARAQTLKSEDSSPQKETPKVGSTPPKAAPTKPPEASGDAAQSQPTLVEMLARVNESHPDILIAQARVQEAQALLVKARFDVAQKMVIAYHNRLAEEAKVADHRNLFEKRLISAQEFAVVKAKLAVAEAESPYAYLEKQSSRANTLSPKRVMSKEEWGKDGPKTPVEWIKFMLPRPVTFSFENVELQTYIQFLRDYTGSSFVLDGEHALRRETPMTLSLDEVPLGAALLAMEDIHGTLRFVVRDYGILVTTEDSIPEDAVMLRDLWKSLNPESSTLTKPATKAKQ